MPIDDTEKSNKLLIKHAGKHCYPWIPANQKSSKFSERSFVLAYERVVNITSCTSILQEFFDGTLLTKRRRAEISLKVSFGAGRTRKTSLSSRHENTK